MIYRFLLLCVGICLLVTSLLFYTWVSAKFLSDNTLKTNFKQMILEVEFLDGYKKVHPSYSAFFSYTKRAGEAIPVEVPNYLKPILNTESMRRYKKLTGKEGSESQRREFVTSKEVKQKIIEFNNKMPKEIAYLEPPDSGFSRKPFSATTFRLNCSMSFLLSQILIESGNYQQGLSIISSLLAARRAMTELRGFESLPSEHTLNEMVAVRIDTLILNYLLRNISGEVLNKSPYYDQIMRNINWLVERDSFRAIIESNLSLPDNEYRSDMELLVYDFDEIFRVVLAIFPKEFNWKFIENLIIRMFKLQRVHYQEVLDLYISNKNDVETQIAQIGEKKLNDAKQEITANTITSTFLVSLLSYFLFPAYLRDNYAIDSIAPYLAVAYMPNLSRAYKFSKKTQLIEEKALEKFGQ